MVTADVETAFLNAEMEGEPVHMRLTGIVAKTLVEIAPEMKEFLDQKGNIIVRLHKALYGLIKSPMLWYKKLVSIMEKAEMRTMKNDPCIFLDVGESQVPIGQPDREYTWTI